jgi:hypothetical protein
MNNYLAESWHPEQIPDAPASSLAPGPADFADFPDFPAVAWDVAPAKSAKSAGGYVQPAILPADSILADWYEHARGLTEGADCYLAGSILPVVSALLGRRVWMHLCGRRQFPNLFALICGKPGDRKTTTIRLAAGLARLCLPESTFLPANFSPESLFDEYDETRGGRPDKFWIVDDANAVLTDWQKTCNGERAAARFLELYDCAALSETFRRNKGEEEKSTGRRVIPETSTSIIFGATFNVACFQGQTVRAGMARRFLYYAAERRGCDIFDSPPYDPEALSAQADAFRRCLELEGQLHFAPDSQARWREYQEANRAAMDAASPLAEDFISRLSSAPAQVLSVAMVFEAAQWARRGGDWRGWLSPEALACAIAHVDGCLDAAGWLDSIAHRASIAEDAEVLHARIVQDFAVFRRGETIYIVRRDLTRAYCHDSSRRGALRPHDLYTRLLPALIGQNKARLVVKEGKREVYAFRVEE